MFEISFRGGGETAGSVSKKANYALNETAGSVGYIVNNRLNYYTDSDTLSFKSNQCSYNLSKLSMADTLMFGGAMLAISSLRLGCAHKAKLENNIQNTGIRNI